MAIPRNLANIAPHVNASSTELVVNDGGANLDFRVEGDTDANLLVADAGAEKVGFGTNTFNTNGGVIQVSNGISFPATQSALSDANTLDDYEEGTWTPAIIGSTTAGTGTYSGRSGTYTKIGRMVYVRADIEWSAHTGTGSMRMNGLPFTSSVEAGVSIGQFANITLTAGNVLYAAVYGDSTVRFWESPTGGGAGGAVAMDTAAYIILGFSYLTTT